ESGRLRQGPPADIGSCGVPRPSLADYAMETGQEGGRPLPAGAKVGYPWQIASGGRRLPAGRSSPERANVAYALTQCQHGRARSTALTRISKAKRAVPAGPDSRAYVRDWDP